MEQWQHEYITRNFPDLIGCTYVNSLLLARLQSEEILSRADADAIKSRSDRLHQATTLYEILLTRYNAYDLLLKALLETNQSAAAQILLQGKSQYEKKDEEILESEESENEPEKEPIPFGEPGKHFPVPRETENTFKTNVDELDAYMEDSSNTRIILIGSIDPTLTAEKIKNTLTGKNLETQDFSSWLQWKNWFFRMVHWVFGIKSALNTLYMVYDTEMQEDIKDKYKDLFYWFHTNENCKKVIIILPQVEKVLEKYRHEYFADSKKVTVLADHFEWNQLTEPAQKIVMNRNVLGNGNLIQLKKFCKSYVYENKEMFKSTILKGELLAELLNYKKAPIVLRQTIPLATKNYISRTIRSRDRISTDIFQKCAKNEVIYISGVESLEKLKMLTGNRPGQVDTSSNQLEKPDMTVKLIFLEPEDDFEDCCKNIEKYSDSFSIHWLELQKDKNAKEYLLWKKTKGKKMDSLHQNLCKSEDQAKYSDSEIQKVLNLRSKTAPLILCDSPGMGKTYLFANLAVQTQQPGTIVLYFVMTDFFKAVKHRVENTDAALVASLKKEVFSNASSYQLQEEMFFKESKECKIFMFFDGLDEVPVDSLDFSIKCLQHLIEIFKYARIHISTRPHLLLLAELSFNTLGYNIQPFELKDQIEFLTKYWSQQQNVVAVDTEKVIEIDTVKLKSFTEECLLALENALLTSTENDIAGIPLQCLLIGEVFEEKAIRFAKKRPNRSSENGKPSIKIKSITDLYEKMVERKFSSFQGRSEQKGLLQKPLHTLHLFLSIQVLFTSTDWAEKMRSAILTERAFQGLKKMFPKWNANLHEFKRGQLPIQQIIAIGIMEKVDEGKLQFVHRTYAEYFLARFTVKQFRRDYFCHSSKFINFIDSAVLETKSVSVDISMVHGIIQQSFEFKLPVVCRFINLILEKEETNTRPNEIVIMSRYRDNIQRACIHHDCQKLLELYIYHSPRRNRHQARTLLQLVAKLSSPKIFDLFDYKTYEQNQNCDVSVLYVAIERGNHEMVAHIYSRHFQNAISNWSNKLKKSLLHACIANTTDCNDQVINDKLKIMNLMTKFIPECTKGQLLSTIQRPVHVHLLTALLAHIGTDQLWYERNECNETILHVAAGYLTAVQYTLLLKFLHEQHESALGQLCNNSFRDTFGRTVLHGTVRRIDCSPEVVEYFKKYQANFNNFDYTGYGIVYTSIKYKRNLECVKLLLENSKVANGEDRFKRTALHIAAKHSNDKSLFRMIIEDYGPDVKLAVNLPDKYGNTPAFYALGNSNACDVLQWLHGNEADFSLRNNKGETILHWAAEQGNVYSIQLILKYCHLQDRWVDKKGHTSLHHALRASIGRKSETVRILSSQLVTDVGSSLLYGLTRRHPDIDWQVIENLEPLVNDWSTKLVCRAISHVGKQSPEESEIIRYTVLMGKIITKLCV